MKLDFAFFAESAVLLPNGFFSVLNGGVEWVEAKRFPAKKLNLVLVARLSFESHECGQSYKCVVKATAPDGEPITPDLAIEFCPPPRIRHPELGNTFALHYGYDRFMFQKAGFHRFSFSLGEVSLGSIAIEAVESFPS